MAEIESKRNVRMTEVGWAAAPGMSQEQWAAAGRRIATVGGAWRWWLGDWINFASKRWGDKYDEAVEITGLSYQSLADAARVSRVFDISRRRENLSWSHHEEVASLDHEAQDHWLNLCENEGLSRKKLRKALEKAKALPSTTPTTRSTASRQLDAGDTGEQAGEAVPLHTIHFNASIEREGDELTEIAEKANAALRDLGFDKVDWKVAA